jgi:hypothetical protein
VDPEDPDPDPQYCLQVWPSKLTLFCEGSLPFSSPMPAATFFFCCSFLMSFLEAGILTSLEKCIWLSKIEHVSTVRQK